MIRSFIVKGQPLAPLRPETARDGRRRPETAGDGWKPPPSQTPKRATSTHEAHVDAPKRARAPRHFLFQNARETKFWSKQRDVIARTPPPNLPDSFFCATSTHEPHFQTLRISFSRDFNARTPLANFPEAYLCATSTHESTNPSIQPPALRPQTPASQPASQPAPSRPTNPNQSQPMSQPTKTMSRFSHCSPNTGVKGVGGSGVNP